MHYLRRNRPTNKNNYSKMSAVPLMPRFQATPQIKVCQNVLILIFFKLLFLKRKQYFKACESTVWVHYKSLAAGNRDTEKYLHQPIFLLLLAT